jgi:PAS domain S-box-containing protein
MGHENLWYQDLFYQNPQAMVVYDAQSLNILRVNEATISLYGYSYEELYSMKISQLRHPENREQPAVEIAGEKPSTFEGKHLTKDGETIYVHIISHPIVFNQINGRVLQIQNISDRKRLEENAVKDSKKFESLVKNSEDIITVTDEAGKMTYVNPRFTAKTGFTPDEILNQPGISLLHPDEVQKSIELRPALMIPGSVVSRRHRVLKKDGSYLWVEGTVTNLVHDEAVQGFVSNYRDISHQIEAEKEIQEAKTDLKAVFESAVEGFTVTDPDLIIKSFNKVALGLFFGLQNKRKLETGQNLMDYIEPGRKSFFKEQIDRVLSGEIIEYDRKHETGGSPQWIRYAIYPLFEDGLITRICFVGRDQTEAIQIENQLKNNEHLFKTLVQEGYDLINVVDFDGNYKYLSQSVNSVLYDKAAQYIGTSAFDLVHPEDRAKLHEEFQALRTVKRAKSTPYRFNIGNGVYRWIETVATNLMDEPGIEGIVINSRDITDTMNHLQAIEHQNKLLQEIAWLQAHKVRAPLSSILGIIDLFSEDLEPAQLQELLTLLKTSATQLDEIIRQIVERSDTRFTEKDKNPPAAS